MSLASATAARAGHLRPGVVPGYITFNAPWKPIRRLLLLNCWRRRWDLRTSGERHECAPWERPGRDAYHHLFEDTLNCGKRAQQQHRGRCSLPVRAVGAEPERRPNRGDSTSSRAIRPSRCVQAGNFPRALQRPTSPTRAGCGAILTGRISEVRGAARPIPPPPHLFRPKRSWARQRQVGLWLQDSWARRNRISLNGWRPLRPHVPCSSPRTTALLIGDLDDVHGVSGVGNLFKPGALIARRRRSGN